jgi:hypothetical protein
MAHTSQRLQQASPTTPPSFPTAPNPPLVVPAKSASNPLSYSRPPRPRSSASTTSSPSSATASSSPRTTSQSEGTPLPSCTSRASCPRSSLGCHCALCSSIHLTNSNQITGSESLLSSPRARNGSSAVTSGRSQRTFSSMHWVSMLDGTASICQIRSRAGDVVLWWRLSTNGRQIKVIKGGGGTGRSSRAFGRALKSG